MPSAALQGTWGPPDLCDECSVLPLLPDKAALFGGDDPFRPTRGNKISKHNKKPIKPKSTNNNSDGILDGIPQRSNNTDS